MLSTPLETVCCIFSLKQFVVMPRYIVLYILQNADDCQVDETEQFFEDTETDFSHNITDLTPYRNYTVEITAYTLYQGVVAVVSFTTEEGSKLIIPNSVLVESRITITCRMSMFQN